MFTNKLLAKNMKVFMVKICFFKNIFFYVLYYFDVLKYFKVKNILKVIAITISYTTNIYKLIAAPSSYHV